MSFSQLRRKDVVNVCDGKRLGRPIDVMFNQRSCIEALVVPGPCTVAGMFSRDREGIVIPWDKVKRIGDDVILVEIDPSMLENGEKNC